jgi:hypothetical protein
MNSQQEKNLSKSYCHLTLFLALHRVFAINTVLNKINPRLYLNYLLSQIHSLRQKTIEPST